MRRTTTDDGREVVVKRGDGTAEAAGLRWLRVDGGPPIADVVEASGERLVVAYVEQAAPTRAAAERFGRELAVMHAAGAPAFGAPPPQGRTEATIGTAPMRNVPAPAWPAWYVADRVLPYLRSARDNGGIDAYAEAAPLAAGRRERVALHQLFPLLVHATLFGGGYGRRAGRAAFAT